MRDSSLSGAQSRAGAPSLTLGLTAEWRSIKCSTAAYADAASTRIRSALRRGTSSRIRSALG